MYLPRALFTQTYSKCSQPLKLHLGNFYKVNTGHEDLSELRPPTGNHGLESPKSYVTIQTLWVGQRRHLNNDLTLLPLPSY